MTILDENGNPLYIASPFVVGWVYIGLFGGFVIVSTLVVLVFRKPLRRVVLAAAVILRTPAAILRVVRSSWTLMEEPSFFRGIVGIWVLGGMILVTAYQIDVFITQGRTELTAVQPGTAFSNDSSTSSAGTTLSLSLVLFQTPITCDPSTFTLTFSALSSESSGLRSGPPSSCVVDPTFPHSLWPTPSLPLSASPRPPSSFQPPQPTRAPSSPMECANVGDIDQ